MEQHALLHGGHQRARGAALRAPTDGTSITGWPTLSWYAASGARYYQVAYGTENDRTRQSSLGLVTATS